MITSAVPRDWRALERAVARILSQAGLQVTRGKRVDTVRGSVVIDVHALHEAQRIRSLIFVECKRWGASVPKTVVHAFRTVVSDAGANAGYVISARGFQKGAYEAAIKSNVRLVTWLEFQDAFEVAWYDRYFRHQLRRDVDKICTLTEPFAAGHLLVSGRLKQKHAAAYQKVVDRYDTFGFLCVHQFSYIGGERLRLPLRDSLPPEDQEKLPPAIVSAVDYTTFLRRAKRIADTAYEELSAHLGPRDARRAG